MTRDISATWKGRIELHRAHGRRLRTSVSVLFVHFEIGPGTDGTEGPDPARMVAGEFELRLRHRVRDSDEVLAADGRFAVILPGAGVAEATVVRRRLLAELSAPFQVGRRPLHPRVQIDSRTWCHAPLRVGAADDVDPV